MSNSEHRLSTLNTSHLIFEPRFVHFQSVTRDAVGDLIAPPKLEGLRPGGGIKCRSYFKTFAMRFGNCA
jgi:hypothetical protein